MGNQDDKQSIKWKVLFRISTRTIHELSQTVNFEENYDHQCLGL